MPPREVFLSHSSEDHAAANRLAGVLRSHGVPAFFSPHNILGAQQWQDEILLALKRCDWFVVLLSPAAVNSMWVRREIAFALAEPHFAERIIPLIHQPCDLGMVGWLKLFQAIDFASDFDCGCRGLLKLWGIGLKS